MTSRMIKRHFAWLRTREMISRYGSKLKANLVVDFLLRKLGNRFVTVTKLATGAEASIWFTHSTPKYSFNALMECWDKCNLYSV